MQKLRTISVEAVKSKVITSGDSLEGAILDALRKVRITNGNILVITSKVVAVTQGRVIEFKNEKAFNELVNQEADEVFGDDKVTLTLKNGIFTPWAGIDRSNTKAGTAVLWPENATGVANGLKKWLKKTYGLKEVGVIIADSFCVPLRKGVTGIALAHCGFAGVNDRRGKKDLYGNTLKVTQEAVADSLATMANLAMGQGSEQTPFAIIRNAPVKFTSKKTRPGDLIMDRKECLYAPLYSKNKPKKSRRSSVNR